MEEDWGFYERMQGSERMRVLVNRHWKAKQPLEAYPYLLSVTVNLYPFRDRKMPRQQGIKMLESLETELEELLLPDNNAKYVGRINTPTRLEFYYYTNAAVHAIDLNRQLNTEDRQYRLQCYSKPDQAWSFYSFLLPSELEEMCIHNAQMVYALIHKGDNIEQPRQVYHWLMFQHEEARKEARIAVEQIGYTLEDTKTANQDPKYPYPLVISKVDNVKLETVNARVRELAALLEETGGRYDGWGSAMKLPWLHRARVAMRRLLGAPLKKR